MSDKRLRIALRSVPVVLALIMWGTLAAPVSAHQTGSPGSSGAPTTTTPSQTTPSGTTATQSPCSLIESIVSEILQMFGATATYSGCKLPTGNMTTSNGTSASSSMSMSTSSDTGAPSANTPNGSTGTPNGSNTSTAPAGNTSTTPASTPSGATSGNGAPGSTQTAQPEPLFPCTSIITKALMAILQPFGIHAAFHGCQ
ncbi:hypothetical protein EPA93_25665 [Ktedonosporobacter rubrisoli]|uniref:Uncharacterized protein n=1 Tax=Ktedonosporobacter rubrisoli TaxID=2509675 RepID=A0A4P6JV03_KTERU|nr:hypothetical protein [Ktedonosporobacter rubrisoli]QBD79183.1 hypothetical protein EPA93_25665 [Ktedonosporobacter rubrisoli]